LATALAQTPQSFLRPGGPYVRWRLMVGWSWLI
jgi:hypothetical protein